MLQLKANTEAAAARIRSSNERRAREKAFKEAEHEREKEQLAARGLNPYEVCFSCANVTPRSSNLPSRCDESSFPRVSVKPKLPDITGLSPFEQSSYIFSPTISFPISLDTAPLPYQVIEVISCANRTHAGLVQIHDCRCS